MAQYNKKALLNKLGVEEEEPQQIDPIAPKIESPVAAPMDAAPAGPAAPDYTKRGQFATFNMGADDKYNRPWDQLSERYKMQTVLSNFDPNAGITPEVIAALNAANINGATFSGSKDKLDARGLKNWEHYDGREGIGDIIQGFNDPNRTNKSWGAWAPEDGGAPGGGGMAAGGGLDPRLMGDPMAGIQEALGKLGSSENLQALLRQLGAV